MINYETIFSIYKASAGLVRTTEAPMLVPHGTFLTREKTDAAVGPGMNINVPQGVVFGKKAKKEPLVRKAYLQLDVLKPGDVFVSMGGGFLTLHNY